MRFQKRLQKGSLVFLFFLLAVDFAQAQEGTYDRYSTILRPRSNPSLSQKIAADFLTYPFEVLRWPTDQSLIFVERYRLDKKTKWIYEKLVDHGITPWAHLSLKNFGSGTDIDMMRLIQKREAFPDFVAKGWIDWARELNSEMGSKIGFERILNTGFRAYEIFRYRSRPEDHFYGLGPDASLGEGTSYKQEDTLLESKAGYRWGPSLTTDVKFDYQNINITNGEDGGRGIIDTTFAPQFIPGLDGDELITLGADLDYDTRNREQNSTQGGRHRLDFSYNEGTGNSDVRYFHYELELSHYFRLGTDRRVFAVRFYGEHNNQAEGHVVPFYNMAKLGGYGAYPWASQTLRAYDFNRFFGENAALLNLEYRYTIWEYRDFKLDTVFTFDEGQVFRKFSHFQFKDFRESYGMGFRLSVANIVLLSVEGAHGDEGTNFYVRSSAPF